MAGKRAVFLDRDGTINVEREYLHRKEEFAFLPGAPAAIRALNQAGFLVVVVTNQSGVARGYFAIEAVHRLHAHLDAELANHGARVDAYYVCPHHPDGAQGEYRCQCHCRKPLPGMLLEAAAAHHIDLAASWLVGDTLRDAAAAQAAGCRPLLVQSGHPLPAELPAGVPVLPDLAAAVALILAE